MQAYPTSNGMKLLMITGLGSAKDLASGRKGAFYNTLEEFKNYWDEIDIISPRIADSKSSIPYVFDPFEHLGPSSNVKVHILSAGFSLREFLSYKKAFLEKAIEVSKEGQKFDLITVQDYPPFYNGYLAWMLSKKIKVPYVSEIHHIPGYPKASNRKEKFFYSQLWFWRLYWALFGSKALAVRVVNKKQTPDFLKKAGVPENKIKYIPSMYIDLDTFKPMGLQKDYDLIFVGRMESNKGVNLFLDAVKKLNYRAVMVGDGSLFSKIKNKIKYLNLNIEMKGRADELKDVAELVNKSKILVMPSYNEGGPRVVLEAMACGVPVLATNVGLIPDFGDKKSVKIIDWDAEDIAQKAKELLENENESKKLVTAGLEIAKQFEKRAMIKNYADELKRVISN